MYLYTFNAYMHKKFAFINLNNERKVELQMLLLNSPFPIIMSFYGH